MSLRAKYPALPSPPKAGARSLCGSRENNPKVVSTVDCKKVYRVRGTTFEVAEHYELLKAVGTGAYGVVCSALDLRLVPGCPHYLGSPGEEPPGAALVRVDPDGWRDRPRLSNGLPSPYVVIKKVPKLFDDVLDARRVLREITALETLRGHPDIIRLLDLHYPLDARSDFNAIYLVTELLDADLSSVLRSPQVLLEDHWRVVMYQLLRGLAFVHRSGFIHRDVKPANVLLSEDCDVKLCDFGLARGGVCLDDTVASRPPTPRTTPLLPDNGADAVLDDQLATFAAFQFRSPLAPPEPRRANPHATGSAHHAATQEDVQAGELTDYVVTRYYRAPELLIMSSYDHSADMWSAGCVFADMVLRHPAFTGTDYLSQLMLLLETPGLAGVPQTAQEVDSMFQGGREGKEFIKSVIGSSWYASRRSWGSPPDAAPSTDQSSPYQKAQLHEALFGDIEMSSDALSLLSSLLNFNPSQRPTAAEALRHPFFASLYSPGDELLGGDDIQVSGPVGCSSREAQPESGGVHGDWGDALARERRRTIWKLEHCPMNIDDLRELFSERLEHYARRRVVAK